jgi:hypothetical protein
VRSYKRRVFAKIYGNVTPRADGDTRPISRRENNARRPLRRNALVEFLYVLLVIVLTAMTIGFLMICDRLGRR